MNFKFYVLFFTCFILSFENAYSNSFVKPSKINGTKSIEIVLGYRRATATHIETSSNPSFFSLGREYGLPDYSLDIFHNFNILRFKRMAIEIQLGGGVSFARKKIEDEGANLKLRESSFSPKYAFGARVKLPYFSIYKNYFQPTFGLRNSTVMFKGDLTYSRYNRSNESRIDYKYDLTETEMYGTLRLMNIYEETYLDVGYAIISDSITNVESSSEVAGRSSSITPLTTKGRGSSKIFLGFGMMY